VTEPEGVPRLISTRSAGELLALTAILLPVSGATSRVVAMMFSDVRGASVQAALAFPPAELAAAGLLNTMLGVSAAGLTLGLWSRYAPRMKELHDARLAIRNAKERIGALAESPRPDPAASAAALASLGEAQRQLDSALENARAFDSTRMSRAINAVVLAFIFVMAIALIATGFSNLVPLVVGGGLAFGVAGLLMRVARRDGELNISNSWVVVVVLIAGLAIAAGLTATSDRPQDMTFLDSSFDGRYVDVGHSEGRLFLYSCASNAIVEVSLEQLLFATPVQTAAPEINLRALLPDPSRGNRLGFFGRC